MNDLDLVYPKSPTTKAPKPVSRAAVIASKGRFRSKGTSTPTDRTNDRSSERPIARTFTAKGRKKGRHSFEFYNDQIDDLKELRKKAILKDDNFNMSEFVRGALDKHLEKNK